MYLACSAGYGPNSGVLGLFLRGMWYSDAWGCNPRVHKHRAQTSCTNIVCTTLEQPRAQPLLDTVHNPCWTRCTTLAGHGAQHAAGHGAQHRAHGVASSVHNTCAFLVHKHRAQTSCAFLVHNHCTHGAQPLLHTRCAARVVAEYSSNEHSSSTAAMLIAAVLSYNPCCTPCVQQGLCSVCAMVVHEECTRCLCTMFVHEECTSVVHRGCNPVCSMLCTVSCSMLCTVSSKGCAPCPARVVHRVQQGLCTRLLEGCAHDVCARCLCTMFVHPRVATPCIRVPHSSKKQAQNPTIWPISR